MAPSSNDASHLEGESCLEQCGGTYHKQAVVECFSIRGDTVCIEDVPALVCDVCGDRQFSAEVTARMQHILRERRTPDRHVPAYRFPKEEASAHAGG